MLRYFYFIICIHMCFCSIYVDNSVDYETVSRRIRSKTTRLTKEQTRSPKSRLVNFDVQNFLQGADEAANDYRYYGSRNKKRNNRYTSTNDVGYVETHEASNERSKPVDYSNINDHAGTARVTTRSQDRFLNPRHFNFHSQTNVKNANEKTSHDHKKATGSYKNRKVTADERIVGDLERKCSFRNMRIPFFSRNKATAKAKRHKKRRIFCFNCKKTTTASRGLTTSPMDDNPDSKPDSVKDNPNPSSLDKTIAGINKVSKRSYGPLCPKCIRELLLNLKKKTTTKKVKHSTTEKVSKTTSNKKTTKPKADLEDSLQDGLYNIGNERMKRNEEEEQERERRLKELEEVEKKIENVHVAAPNFNRGNLNN